jgi:hypothetical protein
VLRFPERAYYASLPVGALPSWPTWSRRGSIA